MRGDSAHTDAAQLEGVSRAFLASLDEVSGRSAWVVACREWLRLRHQISPLLVIQETLLGEGVRTGRFDESDLYLLKFFGTAATIRAEVLLPRCLRSPFVHAALCGFMAARWGHLPERLFPGEIRRSMHAAWPRRIHTRGVPL